MNFTNLDNLIRPVEVQRNHPLSKSVSCKPANQRKMLVVDIVILYRILIESFKRYVAIQT